MATETVQTRDKVREGHLGLSATRCAVNPRASLVELLDDCECLFGSAMGALESMTDTAVGESAPPELSEPWYAMLYTMRQARTVFLHAYDAAGVSEAVLASQGSSGNG